MADEGVDWPGEGQRWGRSNDVSRVVAGAAMQAQRVGGCRTDVDGQRASMRAGGRFVADGEKFGGAECGRGVVIAGGSGAAAVQWQRSPTAGGLETQRHGGTEAQRHRESRRVGVWLGGPRGCPVQSCCRTQFPCGQAIHLSTSQRRSGGERRGGRRREGRSQVPWSSLVYVDGRRIRRIRHGASLQQISMGVSAGPHASRDCDMTNADGAEAWGSQRGCGRCRGAGGF